MSDRQIINSARNTASFKKGKEENRLCHIEKTHKLILLIEGEKQNLICMRNHRKQ